jgi:hypothetical protein
VRKSPLLEERPGAVRPRVARRGQPAAGQASDPHVARVIVKRGLVHHG